MEDEMLAPKRIDGSVALPEMVTNKGALLRQVLWGRAMDVNQLTGRIIEAAIEVHKTLGPGFLVSAYEECLCRELDLNGLRYTQQETLPIEYKGVRLDCGYRIDVLVEDVVIVELKSVEKLEAIHEAQLLTYLKLTGRKVGLLINFNVPVLRDGIKRMML
jgi:GxxExxY protein